MLDRTSDEPTAEKMLGRRFATSGSSVYFCRLAEKASFQPSFHAMRGAGGDQERPKALGAEEARQDDGAEIRDSATTLEPPSLRPNRCVTRRSTPSAAVRTRRRSNFLWTFADDRYSASPEPSCTRAARAEDARARAIIQTMTSRCQCKPSANEAIRYMKGLGKFSFREGTTRKRPLFLTINPAMYWAST